MKNVEKQLKDFIDTFNSLQHDKYFNKTLTEIERIYDDELTLLVMNTASTFDDIPIEVRKVQNKLILAYHELKEIAKIMYELDGKELTNDNSSIQQ